MDKIKELYVWDFPDRHLVPDGYDLKNEPDLSAQNFLKLRDKVNELINRVNALSNKE